jgi:hypothetical protein
MEFQQRRGQIILSSRRVFFVKVSRFKTFQPTFRENKKLIQHSLKLYLHVRFIRAFSKPTRAHCKRSRLGWAFKCTRLWNFTCKWALELNTNALVNRTCKWSLNLNKRMAPSTYYKNKQNADKTPGNIFITLHFLLRNLQLGPVS